VSLLSRLRRLSRRLPIDPVMLHRLRRLAGAGFVVSAWLRHGRGRRRAVEAGRPGPVCVVGFHGSVLGIGEAARAFSAALRAAGVEVTDWDISARFGHDVRLDGGGSQSPPDKAGTLVVFLNPRELIQLVAMAGAGPFKDRFVVGAWAWELEDIPPGWRAGFRYVDEVWLPSRFVAEAVAAKAPPGLPLRVLPHPVQARPAPPDRARLGLPADKVMVLTAFDVRSGFSRKNPLAAVRAFRAANTGGQALLVCKAAGVEGAPQLVEALKAEIGQDPHIRLVTDWLSGADMAAILASADIVLSLHRSEGFGLVPAQAMAQGKAVVATGWSANLDFMSPDNSALVDYVLVPVQDPQGLYDGGRWAEADVADAAARLKMLIEDASARQALGERAAADVARTLDPLAIGAQARAWLGL
jgi:glycosyltransferase involved in cell wall biosynthesis